MQKTFLFLADGFEEIEALSVVDVLRRGGITIETVSITNTLKVCGSHNIIVQADRILNEIINEEATCVILPGGMPGASNLGNSEALINYLQMHIENENLTAAICAAPALVLSKLNFKQPLTITCYPGFEKYAGNLNVIQDGVTVDNFVITGKGPGYAVEFALEILKHLESEEVATEVAAGMLLTE